MKYAKPEVSLLERAVDAIQGQGKPGQGTDLPDEAKSASAYEADE
jgi:hypothetical protein